MIPALLARRLVAALILTMTAGAATTVWLAACHDVYRPPTVASYQPLHREAFVNGELGVVRPTYARRYLLQAYRVLHGSRPLDAQTLGPAPAAVFTAAQPAPRTGIEEWHDARQRIPGLESPPQFNTIYYDDSSVGRSIKDLYSTFPNCQDDAFRTAARTLEQRMSELRNQPMAVIEWTRAQDAVFANCSGEQLVLPQAPGSADPQLRADFEYQTAAAYFYATQYEEAARRFRQIGADPASSWQPYGRYLAARALIRQATVRENSDAERHELLKTAQEELDAVLRNRRTAALHASARGLLGFIDLRVRPRERLTELAEKLEGAGPTSQDVEDYRWLMDRVGVVDAEELGKANGLIDWTVTTQSSRDESLARARQRWGETNSPAWLVSVLWKMTPGHDGLADVMTAAATVPRSSPAYPTVAFLRVRLLLASGERDAARRVLATLPVAPEAGIHEDTINLFRAARLRVAASLDEVLANAVRHVVEPSGPPQQLLEDDASELLTHRLPLDRLVEAAGSRVLPDRIRYRVAAAALSRAVVLDREAAARRSAEALRAVAPGVRSDLARYLQAPDTQERRRLGLMIMARHLGMHAYVPGRRDYTNEPVNQWLAEDFSGAWWCVTKDGRLAPRAAGDRSGIDSMFLSDNGDDFPVFLASNERAAARSELAALVKVGHPQGWLADEAVAWANASPQDTRAAEVLAQVVRRGRWSCSVPASSRRAFETLHRLYPGSVWAQRTKYWYAGHQ